MNISLTGRKLLDIGAWDEVCDVKGWSVWCINEGQMDSSEEVRLSEDELKRCPVVRGYISRKLKGE